MLEVRDRQKVRIQIKDTVAPERWIELTEFAFPKVGTFDSLDSCRAFVLATIYAKTVDWTAIKIEPYPASEIPGSPAQARLMGKDAAGLKQCDLDLENVFLSGSYRGVKRENDHWECRYIKPPYILDQF